jgi:hypothetical protein
MIASELIRDCDRAKGSSFKAAAESLGDPGQFCGVAYGLIPVVQLNVASAQVISAGPLALELGGAIGLAVGPHYLRESAEDCQVGWIGCEEPFQLAPLGGGIAAASGKPASRTVKLGGVDLRGRRVIERMLDDVDPVGGHSPAQPGVPGWEIKRTASLAKIEPARGLVNRAGPDCKIGSAEPDSIVVGRALSGPFERAANGLGRQWPEFELNVLSDEFDGRLERALSQRIQMFPSSFNHSLGFIDSAELGIHGYEQHEQGCRVIAGILGGRVYELFGRPQLTRFLEQMHPALDRSLRERGTRRDACPSLSGRGITPARQLA